MKKKGFSLAYVLKETILSLNMLLNNNGLCFLQILSNKSFALEHVIKYVVKCEKALSLNMLSKSRVL